MATKKKLLQAAAGTAAASGGAALNVEDVFSTYLYEGTGLGQPIENGIKLGNSNDGGSVKFGGNSSGDYITFPSSSDFAFGTGDFTVEAFVNVSINNGNGFVFQISSDSNYYSATAANQLNFQAYLTDFQYGNNANFSAGSTTISYGQFVHLAMARSGTTLKFFVNGSEAASVTDSTNYTGTYLAIGIGYGSAYSLDGYISNFRVVKGTAVYTSAFTVPTSALTAITNTKLLTLQGDTPFVDNSSSARTATQLGSPTISELGPFTGTSGEGGLVWAKVRSQAQNHVLFDTERGATKYLKSNDTSAETTRTDTLTSFNSNGFSLGNDSSGALINTSGQDYASWTFRKAPKFFDVQTWTGNGTAGRTISHDLGTTVGAIFVKSTSGAGDWAVYHRGVDSTAPEDYFLVLNGTDPRVDNINRWNDTAPTSTEFTLGNSIRVNETGVSYVAYIFAHNDGDGDFGPTGDQDIIKCGSYTGNGSASGPEINLGFEPQWLLIKKSTNTRSWILIDNMRNMSVSSDAYLYANLSNAEVNKTSSEVTPTATGFKLTSASEDVNGNDTYIYIAIRRGPMAVPTAATDVFAQDNKDGDDRFDSGWPVDFTIQKNDVTAGGSSWILSARLQGNYYLSSNNTSNESANNMRWDTQDGASYGTNTTDADDWGWMWRRAPNYFDVVAYTGNGVRGRTVSHNLGAIPEMMWIKNRDDAQNWLVYIHSLGGTKRLYLNSTGAAATASIDDFNNTDAEATQFTLGNDGRCNANNQDYIAYLFASLDGVSKVGSYAGNGSSQNIDCGFSSGARFVLIKSIQSGSWYVFDTERGIVAGNDGHLKLNNTDAEAYADSIDPYSSGFTVVQNATTDLNKGPNDETYIFYAIA